MRLRFICLILALVWLSGCEDKFRYPCQDPKNWESDECKPPICTATATCPNDLIPPPKVTQ